MESYLVLPHGERSSNARAYETTTVHEEFLHAEGVQYHQVKMVKSNIWVGRTTWRNVTEGGTYLTEEPLSEIGSSTIKTTR